MRLVFELELCHRHRKRRRRRQPYLIIVLSGGELVIKEGKVAATITDIQKVTATIQVVDAMGNPASVEGIPAWSSDDVSIVAVAQADDGMSAVISSVGPIGNAIVTVTADADLGEGVTTINSDLLVDVIASQATGIIITPGVPEPR